MRIQNEKHMRTVQCLRNVQSDADYLCELLQLIFIVARWRRNKQLFHLQYIRNLNLSTQSCSLYTVCIILNMHTHSCTVCPFKIIYYLEFSGVGEDIRPKGAGR